MTMYSTRYVHKISPSDKDVGPNVELPLSPEKYDHKSLGAWLRLTRILASGSRIREWRVEPDGRIVVFPALPKLTTYWHSVILTPIRP